MNDITMKSIMTLSTRKTTVKKKRNLFCTKLACTTPESTEDFSTSKKPGIIGWKWKIHFRFYSIDR